MRLNRSVSLVLVVALLALSACGLGSREVDRKARQVYLDIVADRQAAVTAVLAPNLRNAESTQNFHNARRFLPTTPPLSTQNQGWQANSNAGANDISETTYAYRYAHHTVNFRTTFERMPQAGWQLAGYEFSVVPAPDLDQAARAFYTAIRDGRDDAVIAASAESMRTPDVLPQLRHFGAMIPRTPPTNSDYTNWAFSTVPQGDRADLVQTYRYPDKTIRVRTSLVKPATGPWQVIGFEYDVQPVNAPATGLNEAVTPAAPGSGVGAGQGVEASPGGNTAP